MADADQPTIAKLLPLAKTAALEAKTIQQPTASQQPREDSFRCQGKKIFEPRGHSRQSCVFSKAIRESEMIYPNYTK
ncbi:hypothetical protein E4U31_005860 [Claviceps sp. LM219 group G6]|nr:hypothetical protein E4U31_005860 [Claviceps sp. LM219 group G6]